jgi:hypothetical protein
MGQVLHGSATTTEAVRRAIQHSQESLRALARRYGVNPKTIAKWKARSSVSDLPTGPKEARSTVLTVKEEAVVVAFWRHTLLPLDDCLYALQPTIPHLMRSSLHRCLQRHGISRLPQVEGEASPKRKFKAYPIGFFHVDIAEVRTAEGRLHLIVAIDRTSKFAFAQLVDKAARTRAATRRLAAIVERLRDCARRQASASERRHSVAQRRRVGVRLDAGALADLWISELGGRAAVKQERRRRRPESRPPCGTLQLGFRVSHPLAFGFRFLLHQEWQQADAGSRISPSPVQYLNVCE